MPTLPHSLHPSPHPRTRSTLRPTQPFHQAKVLLACSACLTLTRQHPNLRSRCARCPPLAAAHAPRRAAAAAPPHLLAARTLRGHGRFSMGIRGCFLLILRGKHTGASRIMCGAHAACAHHPPRGPDTTHTPRPQAGCQARRRIASTIALQPHKRAGLAARAVGRTHPCAPANPASADCTATHGHAGRTATHHCSSA